MASFAEFLEEVASSDRSDEKPISHEGQIARARELAARVAAGNLFQVDDLVTPRTDAPLSNQSLPHVVVSTRSVGGIWDFRADEAGTTAFGGVFDMRVAHVMNDSTVLHWVESCYFEAYDPAVHDKKDER